MVNLDDNPTVFCHTAVSWLCSGKRLFMSAIWRGKRVYALGAELPNEGGVRPCDELLRDIRDPPPFFRAGTHTTTVSNLSEDPPRTVVLAWLHNVSLSDAQQAGRGVIFGRSRANRRGPRSAFARRHSRKVCSPRPVGWKDMAYLFWNYFESVMESFGTVRVVTASGVL